MNTPNDPTKNLISLKRAKASTLSDRRPTWRVASISTHTSEISHLQVHVDPTSEKASICHSVQLPRSYLSFFAATKQLYEWYFLSVCLSACLSVCLSVTPFWLCSHHSIIMKFSGVITKDHGNSHAKGQGQRSKVKVTESQPNLTVSGLQLQFEFTCDDEMIHIASCCLGKVFFKVIRKISRSHGAKNRRIWPRLGVTGL